MLSMIRGLADKRYVVTEPGIRDGGGRSRLWTATAYVYALLVVAGLGYVLLGAPIQVTDGYTNMIRMPGSSLGSLVYSQFFQRAYVRPLLWGHVHVIFTLSNGHYFEWFRGWHVFQVLLLVLLFVRLLRPVTAADAAVIPLALAILIGIHTFAGTIREAFPINTFMTVLLCCVGAAHLALGSHRWWRDLLAAALFVFAALTVESGLLVWVVFMAAFLAGGRGVSRAGMVALTLLFAGYFYLRFEVLESGGPGLIERVSGFGFRVYEPKELLEMFGRNPYPFYAYNVLTSMASVLWSEPRAGIFAIVRSFMESDVKRYMIVNLLASFLSTGVLAWFLWGRRKAWLARRFERADQIVFVFLAVLAANAVISYPYTKDVIMSPAGVFYALAVAVAARELIVTTSTRRLAGNIAVVVLGVASIAWGVRSAAAHVGVRESAAKIRNEWAYLELRMQDEGRTLTDPVTIKLQQQLYDDALIHHPPQAALTGDWIEWLDLD